MSNCSAGGEVLVGTPGTVDRMLDMGFEPQVRKTIAARDALYSSELLPR